MAKRTLWNWLFGLMAKPEPRKPMAVPNPSGKIEMDSPRTFKVEGNTLFQVHPNITHNTERLITTTRTVSLTEDEWNEICSREAPAVGSARHASILAGQRKWHPGCEHKRPHPVKENPDGTLYYKGKVYRMIGDHGRHNSKNKRRQG